MSSGIRTLLVGLDAACLPVLEPRLEDGAVTNLAQLFERGVVGELESQIPPWTASAWPSLYTGVNPGKHGVFSFLTFEDYDWDIVNRTDVHEHALWELLDHHGLSSVVVNVPVTHPPRPFDGALVPGFVAPEDPTCHPAGLLGDIREAIGEYRIYSPHSWKKLSRAELLEEYRSLVRMRGEAFRYLTDRFDPEFGFLQFQQTDNVCHELPGDMDAVGTVYEAVDEEIGRVLEHCDPDTVLVASDHGIGEYAGYEFRVNEYLRRHGYVETTTDGRGMPSWSAEFRRRHTNASWRDTLAKRAVSLGASVGLTSQRIGRTLDRLGLSEFALSHVPNSVVRAGTEQIDFPASTAYMRCRTELGVVVDVEDPDAYARTRTDVVSHLEAVRTPDGQPVFETVAPREEFFEGPYVGDVGDVILVPTDFDHLPVAGLEGQVFAPISGRWAHKRHGLVAACGAAIDPDVPLGAPHLYDIAPTVLATLGLPTSARMDGTPLPVVENADVEQPPLFVPESAGRENDATVERRLADLGYLE